MAKINFCILSAEIFLPNPIEFPILPKFRQCLIKLIFGQVLSRIGKIYLFRCALNLHLETSVATKAVDFGLPMGLMAECASNSTQTRLMGLLSLNSFASDFMINVSIGP